MARLKETISNFFDFVTLSPLYRSLTPRRLIANVFHKTDIEKLAVVSSRYSSASNSPRASSPCELGATTPAHGLISSCLPIRRRGSLICRGAAPLYWVSYLGAGSLLCHSNELSASPTAGQSFGEGPF